MSNHSQTSYLLPAKSHRKYVLGGNALFTILNSETEIRYTYKVVASKKDSRKKTVKVMSGSDNVHSYTYLGNVWKDQTFYHNSREICQDDPRSSGFNWLLRRLTSGKELPSHVYLYHHGTCGHCGRVLTTPESIESGIGPICEGRN